VGDHAVGKPVLALAALRRDLENDFAAAWPAATGPSARADSVSVHNQAEVDNLHVAAASAVGSMYFMQGP
jgi:hypothetical protein